MHAESAREAQDRREARLSPAARSIRPIAVGCTPAPPGEHVLRETPTPQPHVA